MLVCVIVFQCEYFYPVVGKRWKTSLRSTRNHEQDYRNVEVLRGT